MTSVNTVHHLSRNTTSSGKVWVIPVLLFTGILGLGAFIAKFSAKSYQAEGAVEIKLPPVAGLTLPKAFEWIKSEALLPSQRRVVRSFEFLQEYAKKAGLSERWNLNEADTLSKLQKSLRVVENPETNTMILQFTSTDQNQAVEIVNGIGNAFTEHWRNTQNNGAKIEVIKLAKDLLNTSGEIRAEGIAMLKSLDAEVAAVMEATRGLETNQTRTREIDSQLQEAYRQSEALQLAARFTRQATPATTMAVAGPISPIRLVYPFIFALVASSVVWTVLSLQNRRKSATRGMVEAMNQVHLPAGKPVRTEKPETVSK